MQERFIYIRSAYRKFIDDIASFIFLDEELEKADVIFIPGGSYSEIVENAAKQF